MEVSIFNLMGYSNRGVPAAAIYDQTIAQVKAAEAAGFNISWFAERHSFLSDNRLPPHDPRVLPRQ
jgi:alkanesulfonate monooxygenase SsuD/methylene tetrahydromethanopterin reductase-like flavin-dependent oxidoreductase (luciferase family)